MRYALIGYGKMGREIRLQAERRGHETGSIVDPGCAEEGAVGHLDAAALSGADVAFEFTSPDQAEANVLAALTSGRPVVCGTTGWEIGPAVRDAAERYGAGAVIAPNFSVGMNLFYRIVLRAAGELGASGLYDPYVLEWHHRGKLDAPSGTARKLAALVSEADARRRPFEGTPEGALPRDAFHVASLRAGREPGTHVVGFDGEFDSIRVEHRARGRAAFALGAVLAAEWIVGRRGLHGFDAVLEELLAANSEGGIK